MKRVTKKLLATCLSAAMMASVVPFTVLADEIEEDLSIEQEEQAEPEEEEPAVPEEIEEEDEDIIDTEDDDEEEVLDEDGINSWAELAAAIAEGGTQTITLTGDCAFQTGDTGPLVVPEGADIILDLNGKTIDRKASEPPMPGQNVITNNGTLTINDSSSTGSGSITGAYNGQPGGGIINNGTVTLNGGSIQGNIAMGGGAGYCGGANSTLIINGGKICNNTSPSSGAGISFMGPGATAVMNGGEISGNTTTSSGAGVCISAGASFTMNGGTISSNSNTAYGAGVCLLSGSLTLNGGTITQNKSNNNPTTDTSYYGAGVYMSPGQSFSIGSTETDTPIIIENNTSGMYTSGISNLYIPADDAVNIGTIPEGSRIGISLGYKGVFTQNLKNNDISVFSSDSYDYMIIKDDSDPGEAKLIEKCISIYGYKLSVGSSIMLEYYVSIPDDILDDNFEITFEGDGIPTQTLPHDPAKYPRVYGEDLTGLGTDKYYWKYAIEVPAACLTSDITVTVSFTNNDGIVIDQGFSVMDYINQLRNNNNRWKLGYDPTELNTFLDSLLNYGAAAQAKFGVNASTPANTGVALALSSAVGTSTASSSDDPVGNLSFYKASLLCNSETTIKYYFLLPSADTNLSDYVIYVNGEEVTPVINANPNYITVSIPVSAKNYTTKYMVTVSYNGGTETEVCSYSVSDCVATIYANADESDADLKNLLLAMHDYCTYAMTLNAGN